MKLNLRFIPLAFFLIILFRQGIVEAQTLTVASGQTVNITTNTYYDAITLDNNGTLNVIAPAVLTVGSTGTPATTVVVLFKNVGNFLLSSGATMIVNGKLENRNNSNAVQINGTLIVNGDVDGGGTGAVIFGSGTISATGTITTDNGGSGGIIFGSGVDCNTGPCNGNNLCNFSTSNTITASGIINHCTSTNTTPILNGSAITSATYQWQSSNTIGSGYVNVTGGTGATSQNYTPPISISPTRYYRRNATVSGCTQASNIITVTVGATPVITVQPSTSQTVCVGNMATFNVTATGPISGYQWRINTTNIIGEISAIYTIPSVGVVNAATNYNCVITSACSPGTNVISNNAELVVSNTALPVLTASTPATFCVGGNISLNGGTPSGIAPLTSTWTGPNSYASSGLSSNPLKLSPTVATGTATNTMAGTYTHTVTDGNGCKASATTTNSVTSIYLSAVSTTNLIASYDFSGNALDKSGNGNTGTLQGTPLGTADRYSIANNAYSFNGTTQYISTTTGYINPSVFTISAWFKTNTTNGGVILSFGDSKTGVSTNKDRAIYMSDNGNINFVVNNGSVRTITSTLAYNDNTWHHVVASLSGSGMRLYVDGGLTNSNASITSAQNYTGWWKVGLEDRSAWAGATNNFFTGNIDDVSIYNALLTNGEVSLLFTSPNGVTDNDPLCGNALNLTAASITGATYAWTGPASYNNATQNPIISPATATNNGVYRVVATKNGCTSTAYTTVTISNNLSQVPTNGLILRYNLTGNANDASPYSNNGALQGSPTSVLDRNGVAGSAYSFNGTTNYITSSKLINVPINFSTSVWIKTNTTAGGMIVGFSTSQTGESTGSWDRQVYMANNGRIGFSVFPGFDNTINSPLSYNDNQWHQLTATLSSVNGQKLYIDGILVASDATATSPELYPGYWRVGFDVINGIANPNVPVPTNKYFTGTIDDVLIYDRELSAAEVALNATNPSGASTNAPICTGSTLSLTATTVSGATYAWTGPSGFTSGSQNPTIAAATSANSGTYSLTVTAGSCSFPAATTAAVITAPVVSNNTASANQVRCTPGIPTAITGTTPTGGNTFYTYQWQNSTTSATTGFTDISNANSKDYSPGSISVSNWFRRLVVSGGCNSTSTAILKSIANGGWTGNTNTAWNTPSNWCSVLVPTSTTDAIIQPTPNSPIISLNQSVRNITIGTGATVTTTGTNTLSVSGNWVNNGTFTPSTDNTVNFTGVSAQSVTGAIIYRNLTIDKSTNGVALNSATSVSGLLTLTSGALNSSGNLTVNLTTGNIDKIGTGSVTGNMTVVRNASEIPTGWHYVGSPLGAATFTDFNDNVPLTTSNFFAYNENDGSTYIQARWKKLLAAPFSLPLSTPLAGPRFTGGPGSLMTGYAIKFSSPLNLDITGTYAHGSSVSYSTGLMSYTDGGQAWGNGWQLIANPFPSYIDWNSPAITTSNLERGLTYYYNSGGGAATYLPAFGVFPAASTNGGSPFIPAMQSLWVQVMPGGNGQITVGNNARVINPSMVLYPTAPKFYRSARSTVQSFKLAATNSTGTDETCVRFGTGATTKFDSNIDMNKFGNDRGFPSLYSVTDTVEYAVNSLPEIENVKEVNLSLYVSQSGSYTLSIKDLMNMEDIAIVNLFDKQTQSSQNLMLNDTYSFVANKGDADNRFVLTFKPEILTNTQTMSLGNTVDIFSNASGMLNLHVNNSTSEVADIMVTNVLGQEVYKQVSVDIKSGKAEIKLNNVGSGVYIVKAIINGLSYSKEVFIMK